jgi:hypothetical protein
MTTACIFVDGLINVLTKIFFKDLNSLGKSVEPSFKDCWYITERPGLLSIDVRPILTHF